MSSRAARLVTAALITVCAVLVGDGRAWAHAGGLTSSSNEPVVLGTEPSVPGLRVTVVEFGARLRMDNQTPERVRVVPPPGSVVDTLPVVDPGGSVLWSDPRVVAAANRPKPPDAHLGWQIPLRVGETAVEVVGEQRWPPPPDAGLWWLLTVGLAVLPGGLVALDHSISRRRRTRHAPTRRGESPESPRRGGASGRAVLAAMTAAVMAAHVVHLYGSTLVVAQGSLVVVFLAAAGFAVLGWPLGVAGAWLTLRGRPAGPLLCCVASALLAVVIAPADVFSFHDAVIPFAWAADLDRLLVAVTVGGGLGAVGAAWLLMREAEPTPVTQPARDAA